jgi:hypothetical protein
MESPPNPSAPYQTPSYYYPQQHPYPVEQSTYYYPQNPNVQQPSYYPQQQQQTVQFICELCKHGANPYYPVVTSIRPCSKVHFFHSTCLQTILEEPTCRFCSPLNLSIIAQQLKTIPITPPLSPSNQPQTIVVQPDLQHLARRKKRIVLAMVCFIFFAGTFISLMFGLVHRD